MPLKYFFKFIVDISYYSGTFDYRMYVIIPYPNQHKVRPPLPYLTIMCSQVERDGSEAATNFNLATVQVLTIWQPFWDAVP